MSNFMAGSINGWFPKLDANVNKLQVLSIVINNICNLACRHCYLQTSKFEEYLTPAEWSRFFESVFGGLCPAIVCFAGKEVFINEESVEILQDAVRRRDRLQAGERGTQIGVISNGTLLHRFQSHLLETAPDYFDISIDGLPGAHDAVRGRDAFRKLEPNLVWLLENFPGRVWITHTALADNIAALPQFIDYYHRRYGIDRFSVGFYKAQWYTDRQMKLEMRHFRILSRRILPALERLSVQSPLQIQMEFDCTQPEIIDLLSADGWANPVDDIASARHEFDNGLTLFVNTTRVPVGLWRSVRVTPEGYWLAAEDLIHAKDYARLKVATVRDFAYDACQLYAAGLARRPATSRETIALENILEGV